MFFKKKQIDENYAAAERKVEKKPVELTDDIKERYRKSGYEYERLSPEEIWLLFSEKENWQPEYDHKTQESGDDKFIKLINLLKLKKYKYIIFPDLNFSEIKLSNHWFKHYIFLCSIEKYGDEDSF